MNTPGCQRLEEWLRAIGFPPCIELDGAVHRVARSGQRAKNAWYVGWREPYLSVVCGDWSTGEKWHFKEGRDMTRRERQEVQIRTRLAMAEAQRERERKRQLVALRADIVLRSAPTAGSNPYLARKRVAALGLSFDGAEVLIPVRDLAGNTWGYQRILSDGTKLFLPGQKVEGCFHRIDGAGLRLFIAEGYATAASIHMATDATVFCAYHAGNLKEVTRQIATAHPDSEVVVCGDDDRWTAGNPGRAKALDAASAAGARVVFPIFQSLDGRPTDFNDLHCREGLKAVTAQLAEAEF